MPRPPHAVLGPWTGDLVFERPMVEHLYEADYRAVREALESEGWTVTEVASFEMQAAEVVEVFFRFLRDLGDEGLHEAAGLLIGLLIARLRKPRRPGAPKRQATLYKADGEVYRMVDLDKPADDT
jgi:hypothetical protein